MPVILQHFVKTTCIEKRYNVFLAYMAVWLSGNIVGHINEVALHRAGLMQRWVTICGYTILVFNQATQANSAWPSLHG